MHFSNGGTSRGGSGDSTLEWLIHSCADGGRGGKSIRLPPNHIQAWPRLSAHIDVSAVAALPGNGLCGNPFGRHGASWLYCSFLLVVLLVVLLLGVHNKTYQNQTGT